MSYTIGKVGNFFQENNEMITIAINVNDLINNHEICYYDSDLNRDDEDQGYQREPKLPRLSKIAKSLERTINNDTFLPIPTAITLSDRGVNYKFSDGKLDITKGKFKLIDGQHRILAYQKAIEELGCEALKAHYLPCTVILIEKLDHLSDLEKKEIELKHFITINGEAKAVPVDLGNGLLVDLYQSGALKSDEYDDVKIMSTQLAMMLNDECGPWMNKIIMPNKSTYKKSEWNANPKLKRDEIDAIKNYQNGVRKKLKENKDKELETLGEVEVIKSIVNSNPTTGGPAINIGGYVAGGVYKLYKKFKFGGADTSAPGSDD